MKKGLNRINFHRLSSRMTEMHPLPAMCQDLPQIQGVSAVGVAIKGSHTKISTFFGRPLFEVICTNCGQCIDRCPTGALVEKNYIEEVWNAIWDPNQSM